MSIAILLGSVVLLAGLMVRRAGEARIMSIVDSARISDVTAVNRWAGNRILLVSGLAFALSTVTLRWPDLSFPLLGAFMLVVLIGVSSVAAGSSRFQAVR